MLGKGRVVVGNGRVDVGNGREGFGYRSGRCWERLGGCVLVRVG
jgi:hypothetical protein